jgi:AraC-like DNA-binding protein
MRIWGTHTRFDDPDQLQSAVSSLIVPLRVTTADRAGFHADVTSGFAGPVQVARIRCPAHAVTRDARRITSADRELLKVTLLSSGPAAVYEGDMAQGRPYGPGQLAVFDTARPYGIRVTGSCDVTVIAVERGFLGPHADLLARCTGRPLDSDSGTRGVIATFLTGLSGHADDLGGTAGIHLGEALASLIVAAFTDTTAERADVAADLTDRIVAYTLANLADPALSVETVARRHGISPRHLHRLFQRRGEGFASWLRQERLRRVRRDLLDVRLADRTMAVIASRWGIRDHRHLGRALKAQFATSAAELRRSARERSATAPGAAPSQSR